ncbi:MAG: hypothetical protein GY841_22960, partial [FCB group bacterium]|nr:hypothetical protein [FCB group bacterium]
MRFKPGLSKLILCACLIAGLIVTFHVPVVAKAEFTASTRAQLFKPTAVETPNTQFKVHNIGKIALTISNFGTFGAGSFGNIVVDGEIAPSCEYPINSNMEYLYTGALWIGAVVNGDTLVSVGHDGWLDINELYPEAGEAGEIITRSNLKFRSDYDENAISEQDFICSYSDTFVAGAWTGEDPFDNRPHMPINISVDQKSYAWSYDYTEDFIIFEYNISNIGQLPIDDLYMGIYVDAVAYHKSIASYGHTDDISGFRRTVDMQRGICFELDSLKDFVWQDTVNIAWIADNDGDPTPDGRWHFASPTAVTGVRVLQTPNDDLSYSFNWWVSNTNAALDFGPRMTGSIDDPFRKFGSHLGTPTGDRNKYYMLSHPEFDYDQLFTSISHGADGYLLPPNELYAADFADGYDTRYLLSFGPFDVNPGDTLPITVAFLAGEDFHVLPDDYDNFFDPENPQAFYDRLSFEDLGLNARWAGWIYDNPGIDTDNDLDSGVYCWNYTWQDTTTFNPDSSDPEAFVAIDSTKAYYRGDGVPDFLGASPPPPPTVRVSSGYGQITLRWNGQESERFIDNFTGQRDFEGYRVYYGEENRLSDFVLLTAYDLDNFERYEFDLVLLQWNQVGAPITRDSLEKLYGSSFDPNDYYSAETYFTDREQGTYHYFVPHGWNQSDPADPRLIHKIYPDASPNDLTDTTAEGYQRYYEYEYTIDNLQPSKPYYFA